MNKKVLIFGNGQMGNFYRRFFTDKGLENEIAQVDITNKKAVEKAINNFNPSVVINTAAKTNLEWASKNKLETFKVNVLGADNIAQICDKKNVYFIHFSSGCIFESKDKNDLKKEENIPNPGSYYAWTKVWAEQLIKFEKSKDFKYLILRPRQPVSSEVNYKNMLVKFLTFTIFIDTQNAGTVIEDLMDWTLQMIKKRTTGIYHVANQGSATPYEIGLLLKRYVLPSLNVKKVTKHELDKVTPNKRVDTVLDISKLKDLGIKVSDYKERLEQIIKQLGENFKKADKSLIKEQMDKTMAQSKARTIVNDCWKDLLK